MMRWRELTSVQRWSLVWAAVGSLFGSFLVVLILGDLLPLWLLFVGAVTGASCGALTFSTAYREHGGRKLERAAGFYREPSRFMEWVYRQDWAWIGFFVLALIVTGCAFIIVANIMEGR